MSLRRRRAHADFGDGKGLRPSRGNRYGERPSDAPANGPQLRMIGERCVEACQFFVDRGDIGLLCVGRGKSFLERAGAIIFGFLVDMI